MPYTLNPMNSHKLTAKLNTVPTKAPFALANGKNKPKINKPNIGPPVTLKFIQLIELITEILKLWNKLKYLVLPKK